MLGQLRIQQTSLQVFRMRENRIRLRPDVSRSLDYYIAENAAQISGVPGIRMDRNDVVSEIMMNFLADKGHYPPKDGVE
jgi:hypothetical protein